MCKAGMVWPESIAAVSNVAIPLNKRCGLGHGKRFNGNARTGCSHLDYQSTRFVRKYQPGRRKILIPASQRVLLRVLSQFSKKAEHPADFTCCR